MDLPTALAQLLTDPNLRKWFRSDRPSLLDQLAVNHTARKTLELMDGEDLEAQAQALLAKRFHEVRRLIPQTIHRLGSLGRTAFFDYASEHWPTGHRRHWIDAREFLRWTMERNPCCVSRAESNWVQFVTSTKRLEIRFTRDLMIRGRRCRAIQLFTRFRNEDPRQRHLCLEHGYMGPKLYNPGIG